jgi:cellular nucleic acid-binding protein
LVSTPEDANTLIRDGIYICRVKTYPRKLKTEPKQCMKCRKWGHFAADCLEDKDACGNCGENHHTKECPDSSRRYCVSCKNNTHASWDCGCPEFIRRVEQMDENHPENALTYFPTEEDWTKHACPARIDLDTRFPAKYSVASLPPLAMDLRQPPTRQVKSKKRGPKLVQLNGKGPIDDFLLSISGKPCKMEGRQSDDELFNPLTDDEITHQLDNAFTEE